MIDGVKPYPEYKDSGLPWLGAVPAHWDMRRLRASITDCVNGLWGSDPDGKDDILCVRVADFDRVNRRVRLNKPTIRAIPQSARTRRLLRNGDLLIEKSGGGDRQPVGAVVLYDHDVPAVCSNFVARMPLAVGYDAGFVNQLHSVLYSRGINVRSVKQTTGIQNLDSKAYFAELVAFPPPVEQAVIARFLDHAHAKIERAVRAKRNLIALLNEQKQAVIRHTVSRGLDPQAKLKLSGIPWLDEIPSHWAVSRISAVCHFHPGKAHEPFFDPNGRFTCVTARFVSTGGLMRKFCSKNFSPATKGDVLMVMSDLPNGRALAKAFFVVDDNEYAVNQRVCILTAHSIDSKYLFYYANRNLQLLQEDDGANQTHLSNSAFKTMLIPLPPFAEQAGIVAFLDQLVAQTDATIFRAEQEIALLREYRTTLTADVVTGKLDVRDAVKGLPAATEVPAPDEPDTDTPEDGDEADE